jgi:hypothetical protein
MMFDTELEDKNSTIRGLVKSIDERDATVVRMAKQNGTLLVEIALLKGKLDAYSPGWDSDA